MGKKRQSLAANRQFMTIIEESRGSFYAQGGIPIEEIRRELGLKPMKRIGKDAAKKKT